jgi:hypothetical protein
MMTRKAILWTAGVLCIVYFSLSLVFYPYRIYGDSAYYLFRIINNLALNIEHARPVGALIQIIPLLLAKGNAVLEYILMGFSLNEWLYFTLCFLAAVLLFRDSYAALGIWLILLFGSRWNYFNPVSELILASPLFLFTVLLFRKPGDSILNRIIFAGLSYFVLQSHALFIIPYVFIIAFEYTWRRSLEGTFVVRSLILSALMILRYLRMDPYEADPLSNIGNPELVGYQMILKFKFAKFLFTNSLFNLGTLFLATVVSVAMVRQRAWRPLFAYSSFFLGYTLMVIARYGRFYDQTYEPFERYLFVVPMITCIVFFVYFVRELDSRWMYGLLLGFIFIHFVNLVSYGMKVRARYTQLDHTLQNGGQFGESKIMYSVGNIYWQQLGHDWMYNIESMLLSARNNPLSCKQVLIREAFTDRDLEAVGEDDVVIKTSPCHTISTTDLNRSYFVMNEGPVRYCNAPGAWNDTVDACLGRLTISMGGFGRLQRSQDYLLPIKIVNRCESPVPSEIAGKTLRLSYHLYQGDSCVTWEGMRTHVFCEIRDYCYQKLKVRTPDAPGKYRMDVMAMLESEKRYSSMGSIEITVE